MRPWSRKGPGHGVGVDPETVTSGLPSVVVGPHCAIVGCVWTACRTTLPDSSVQHCEARLLWNSKIEFGKRSLLEKGSFQKSPFARDSREFRDSRDSRESPDCGK